MIPAVLLLPILIPALQEPEEPAPLPEGIVARVGDRTISLEEYKDFLWHRFWKRPVQDMVVEILLEQEAERYGIELAPEQVDEVVETRLEATRNTPRQGEFEEDLKRNGQDLEMFKESVRREARRDLLLNELVLATRVVTDERLQQEFERMYGPGGLTLKVRHVLLMPNLLRAEAIRGGKRPNEIDMEEMKRKARALAVEARGRLEAGEDFAVVAAAMSHDQTTKDNGGELRSYNGRLYGPAFKDAVTNLEVGGLSEVVETGAGFHVITLTDRVETKLDDVREELTVEILDSEPTWQEKSALVQALQGKADVQLW